MLHRVMMEIIRSACVDAILHTYVNKNSGRKLAGPHFIFEVMFVSFEIYKHSSRMN